MTHIMVNVAWPYANGPRHIGHVAGFGVPSDVYARYQRMKGNDVLMVSGTDEHGTPILVEADKEGVTPQELADRYNRVIASDLCKLGLSYDLFTRTTTKNHELVVQELFRQCLANGYIYKGSYDGWYCVPEETYFTDTQVRHADEERGTEGEHLCPDCGRPLQRVQEESWFFKLSAFQDRLLELYRDNPRFVEPEIRRNEVVSFVEGGLKDLSISRTSFDWGIELPFDEGHVTYVWFDALINYLTAVGYGSDEAEFAYRWPAQAHLVGKDIIRFHCVIWPAMLMAAGLPVPEEVFAHGFLTVKNEETGATEKMSKSRGNVVSPATVVDLLGVDGYRYYFMTDVKPGTDGGISWGRMEQVYNTDLANSWGNLVSRTLNMSAKYFDGRTPVMPEGWDTVESPLSQVADGLVDRYLEAMYRFAYDEGAAAVMELVHAANRYIEDMEPWGLAKDPARADELAFVIGSLVEAIRVSAHLLAPLMPSTSAEVLRRLSAEDEVGTRDLKAACAWGGFAQGASVTKGDALFPRLVAEGAAQKGDKAKAAKGGR